MSMKTGILAAEAVKSGKPKETYLKSVKPLQQIIRDGKKVQNRFTYRQMSKLYKEYKKTK